jgi:hypothetical protein
MDANDPRKRASLPTFRVAAFLAALALLAGCTPTAARKTSCSVTSVIPAAAERAGKSFDDGTIVRNLQGDRRGKGSERPKRPLASGVETGGYGPLISFVGPTSGYLAGENQ